MVLYKRALLIKRNHVARRDRQVRTSIAYFRSHIKKEESDIVPVMRALPGKDDWATMEKAAPFDVDPLFGNGIFEKRCEALHRQIMQDAEDAGAACK